MQASACQPRPPQIYPITFVILAFPFGALGGYLTVSVAYRLAQAGMSAESIASLIALSYLPHTGKLLWAPVVDTTLNLRTWYAASTLVSAAGIAAISVITEVAPDDPWLLGGVILAASFAATIVGMAVEMTMVYAVAEGAKSRAGGWFQAGTIAGGIAGGGALWLAQRFPPWIPGFLMAAACALCCCALHVIPKGLSPPRERPLLPRLWTVGKDVWSVVHSRRGGAALLLCLLPIGTGATANLWSALAPDWPASATTAALANGVLGSSTSVAGCIVGGYLAGAMRRPTAYLVYGVAQALCAAAMAFLPRTEAMYLMSILVYLFITGLISAGFSALVLEAIGQGGAATKYSLFASLANLPIAAMTYIDGWAKERWGVASMLLVEAAIGMAALVVFLAVVLVILGSAAKAKLPPAPVAES